MLTGAVVLALYICLSDAVFLLFAILATLYGHAGHCNAASSSQEEFRLLV